MASGALAYHGGIIRRPDSPGTIAIVEIEQVQRESAAVSADTVTGTDYVITLDRISDLRAESEEEDQPSRYAEDLAVQVLADTARMLGVDFPRASVSVGPNRGLRITWSAAGGEVRLICGGSEANRSYIYSEHGDQHGVEHAVTGRHLAQHLRWALREA